MDQQLPPGYYQPSDNPTSGPPPYLTMDPVHPVHPFVHPHFRRHWKGKIDCPQGQEGLTPYSGLRTFETARELLDLNNHNLDCELIFKDADAGMKWREKLRPKDPKKPIDETIPEGEQIKAAVKLVFKAFKSIALAKDNAGMLKAFREEKHDNRQVEVVCWQIVESCMDRAKRGPQMLAYDAEKVSKSQGLNTFADRLDAIVDSMSHQKTICKHLLDASYVVKFVDEPIASSTRVESNRKLNKRKGNVMTEGKKVMGISTRQARSNARQYSMAPDDNFDDFSPTPETPDHGSVMSYPMQSSLHTTPRQPMPHQQFETPEHQIMKTDIYGNPPAIVNAPRRGDIKFRHMTPMPNGPHRELHHAQALHGPDYQTMRVLPPLQNIMPGHQGAMHGGFVPQMPPHRGPMHHGYVPHSQAELIHHLPMIDPADRPLGPNHYLNANAMSQPMDQHLIPSNHLDNRDTSPHNAQIPHGYMFGPAPYQPTPHDAQMPNGNTFTPPPYQSSSQDAQKPRDNTFAPAHHRSASQTSQHSPGQSNEEDSPATLPEEASQDPSENVDEVDGDETEEGSDAEWRPYESRKRQRLN